MSAPMPELRPLPDLPKHIGVLRDADASRLRRFGSDVWESPRTECKTCNRTETFMAREGDQTVQYKCNCLTQWMLFRWLLNSGINYRYQTLTWDDATQVPHEILNQVATYSVNWRAMRTRGIGMTLWSSGYGTGKTMLATLVLKGIIADGGDVYFSTFTQMLDMFASTWRDKEEREWFSRRVSGAGFLVIDDIGKESKARGVEAMVDPMVDNLIRRRVSASLPTIVTTNKTPEDMHQRYGGNILSLLSEVNVQIEVPGIDFRTGGGLVQRTMTEATQGLTRPITLGAI